MGTSDFNARWRVAQRKRAKDEYNRCVQNGLCVRCYHRVGAGICCVTCRRRLSALRKAVRERNKQIQEG